MIEPTRGVDVGARLEIYRQIERLAAGGTAVVVVSTDVPEVMSLSERLVTLYSGFVTAEFDPRQASEQQVSLAMQGGLRRLADDQPAEAAL
jgi:ABC-type sugar transport system ATPase subunit